MKMQMGYTHTLTITSRPADDQSLMANAVQGLQCPLLATRAGITSPAASVFTQHSVIK